MPSEEGVGGAEPALDGVSCLKPFPARRNNQGPGELLTGDGRLVPQREHSQLSNVFIRN